MGRSHHLERALLPIRREGGLLLSNGQRLLPELLLVGRDDRRLAELAREIAVERWSTDLSAVLSDPAVEIFFDAALSADRGSRLAAAVSAGKHIYAEKPVVAASEEGHAIVRSAEQRALRHGAVQDKLHLRGMRSLRKLVDEGFFGEPVSFKLDFGYWVYDGSSVPCQRSSWNYRASTDGGMIFDMFPHWRYLIEGVLGPIASVAATAWTATQARVDERGKSYRVDVEDTAHCLVRLRNGVHGVICSSWADRPRRDDILTLRIDGTAGAAIAGAHRCYVQPTASTPRAVWDADRDMGVDYCSQWTAASVSVDHINPFRRGWEGFLRHVAEGAPFEATMKAGIRDVSFAEAVRDSVATRSWVSLDGAT
jgi:predicted dehydrogenase